MRRRLLPLLPLVLLAGCHAQSAQAPDEPSGPQRQGDAIVLDEASIAAAGIASTMPSRALPPPITLPGRLVWDEDRTARVYAPAAGRVTGALAAPGAQVAAGTALAWLAADDAGSAQADLARARAESRRAGLADTRAQDLLAHGVIAARDAEQAAADAAAAQAELARAEARVQAMGLAAGRVDARLPLASPVAGTVVDRQLNPGQHVAADGNALFTVSDPRHLWLLLDGTESALAGLVPGLRFEFTTPAFPGRRYTAELQQVGAAIDPQTRTIKLRAKVDNPDASLKAELFVSAQLAPPGEPVLSLPAAAVIADGERRVVWIDAGQRRYERREVHTAAARDGRVTVLDGLADDVAVLSAGNLYLEQLRRTRETP